MQIVIEIPDEIARRLQKRWSDLTHKVLELVFQAAQQADIVSKTEVESVLQQRNKSSEVKTLAYMERQAAFYEEHREQLLKTHQGQYVVFEDGNVLDADADFEALIVRTFAQNGPIDIFIQQVGAEETVPLVRTPFLSKAV